MPPGVGFKLVSIGPGVVVLNSFFARGVGNSPIKKKLPGGFARGVDGQVWNSLIHYKLILAILSAVRCEGILAR